MPGLMWTTEKNPEDLKPNKANYLIYGNEPIDNQLLDSIKTKGLLEPLVIKDDDTIISGHRRWLVLKKLGMKAQCRVMTFDNELDEKESLIEFNKHRVKNASQIYNEATALRDIIAEKARLRSISNLKNQTVEPLILAGRGDTRDKVSDAVGINRNKLETILNVGELAETGKILTAKERACSGPVTCAKPELKAELKKEVAKEVMQKLNDESISINCARQLVKVIQDKPETAKRVMAVIESKPSISFERAVREVKQDERKEDVKITEPSNLSDGLFDVILCDPPWRYDFAETKNREIENHYPTMSIDEMKALEIPAGKDSVMFMWATAPKLKEAIGVLEAWGFEYKTCAVWDKELIGMGYWWRGSHELLLVGTRGKPTVPEPENRVSSVIRSRRESHSKKPDCVYDIIDKMCPGGRNLEMFARNVHPGWIVWGNQV